MDPEIEKLARAYLTRSPNSRAAKAIRMILESGAATTRDLNMLGYDHPPRAIGDVKDLGFPIVMEMIRAPDGKRMASYRFGSIADVREGQVGRTNFSKAFKIQLINAYGPYDQVTRAEHPRQALQIDHRIPYRVAGDAGLETNDVAAFMLLDAKSQRAKSRSCEQCRNFAEIRDPDICRRGFWAYPDDYDHVAMQQERRVDILWQGGETTNYDELERHARIEGVPVAVFLKRLGDQEVKRSRDG